MSHDLACAWRQIRRSPGFALAVILTLALGIGVNTSIFQVLDALLLRPLPVRDPARLVRVQLIDRGRPADFSYPAYREMAARQTVAEALFATSDYPLHAAVLRGRGPARTINAVLATGGYFDALGVRAGRGRVFTEMDDRAAAPVVVVSDAFRAREFPAGDPIGQVLFINKAAVTVIGVAPTSFSGEKPASAPDAWLPMSLAPQLMATDWLNAPKATWLTVMARLRAGVSRAGAQAALDTLFHQLNPGRARQEATIAIEPAGRGASELLSRFENPVLVLATAAGLVLLIACCNLATLLLGRGTARRQEIGIRLALGAGRARLVRQLLVECGLLAAAGWATALLPAQWGARGLAFLAGEAHMPLDTNWRILLFSAVTAGVTTVLFGLAPALSAAGIEIRSALQGGGRGQTGAPGARRMGRMLVAAQLTISLLLLSGAGLLMRSLWNLRHQDFGFRAGQVLMADLPWEFSPTMMARYAALREPLYERMNALPGVRSAALSCFGPMGGDQHTGPLTAAGVAPQNARIVHVSARYFETLGIPILAGRGITEDDRAGAPAVAVLSETAARAVFGGANPVGRRIAADSRFDAAKAMEVVGVARDVRFSGPSDPFGVLLYVPMTQAPAPITAVLVRTSGDPLQAAGAVRAALHDADPDLAVNAIRPVRELIETRLTHERTLAAVTAGFGILALGLTCVGVYGVIAYAVERRTREIGVRLALGATGRQVRRMMLGELAAALGGSLVLGGAGAAAVERALRTLLFGIAADDYLWMPAVACAVLLVVAAAAAYPPTRRAARLDPMDALRSAG